MAIPLSIENVRLPSRRLRRLCKGLRSRVLQGRSQDTTATIKVDRELVSRIIDV